MLQKKSISESIYGQALKLHTLPAEGNEAREINPLPQKQANLRGFRKRGVLREIHQDSHFSESKNIARLFFNYRGVNIAIYLEYNEYYYFYVLTII